VEQRSLLCEVANVFVSVLVVKSANMRRRRVSISLLTRSHPEMVGDMSRVTLNFDVSKFLLCVSSQGQDLYSHQKLHMYIYWFSSESSYRRRDDDDNDDDANNAGRHSTTTYASYR